MTSSARVQLGRRLWIGRFFAAILLITGLAYGLWAERAPLLRGAADLWIVSDQVTQSDVIAVLGGELIFRPFVAAELYKKGLAAKILVSQVREPRLTEFHSLPGHTEQIRMVLLKLGVPAGAIETFGNENNSTRDEAVALKDWADQHSVSRIIVPTDTFSARRAQWIFHREFAGSSVRLEIPSFEKTGYARDEWWKTKWGITAFQTEIMKYLYYRLKY